MKPHSWKQLGLGVGNPLVTASWVIKLTYNIKMAGKPKDRNAPGMNRGPRGLFSFFKKHDQPQGNASASTSGATIKCGP